MPGPEVAYFSRNFSLKVKVPEEPQTPKQSNRHTNATTHSHRHSYTHTVMHKHIIKLYIQDYIVLYFGSTFILQIPLIINTHHIFTLTEAGY